MYMEVEEKNPQKNFVIKTETQTIAAQEEKKLQQTINFLQKNIPQILKIIEKRYNVDLSKWNLTFVLTNNYDSTMDVGEKISGVYRALPDESFLGIYEIRLDIDLSKPLLNKEELVAVLIHELVHHIQQSKIEYYKQNSFRKEIAADGEFNDLILNNFWILEASASLEAENIVKENKEFFHKIGLDLKKILGRLELEYPQYKELLKLISSKISLGIEDFIKEYFEGKIISIFYKLAEVYGVEVEKLIPKSLIEFICFAISKEHEKEKLEKFLEIAKIDPSSYLSFTIENAIEFRNLKEELANKRDDLKEEISKKYSDLKEKFIEDNKFYFRAEVKKELNYLTVLISNKLNLEEDDYPAMIEIRAYLLSKISGFDRPTNIEFYSLSDSPHKIFLDPKKIEKYKKEIDLLLEN
ncbi:MAG: hypothetical protein QXG16_02395 [Candidatus Anstonellaceae archaeon]